MWAPPSFPTPQRCNRSRDSVAIEHRHARVVKLLLERGAYHDAPLPGMPPACLCAAATLDPLIALVFAYALVATPPPKPAAIAASAGAAAGGEGGGDTTTTTTTTTTTKPPPPPPGIDPPSDVGMELRAMLTYQV